MQIDSEEWIQICATLTPGTGTGGEEDRKERNQCPTAAGGDGLGGYFSGADTAGFPTPVLVRCGLASSCCLSFLCLPPSAAAGLVGTVAAARSRPLDATPNDKGLPAWLVMTRCSRVARALCSSGMAVCCWETTGKEVGLGWVPVGVDSPTLKRCCWEPGSRSCGGKSSSWLKRPLAGPVPGGWWCTCTI